MLLGGLLRIKGMRQMIKSKPYQAERKEAMKETAKAYPTTSPSLRAQPGPILFKFGSLVSRSIAISFALDKSGKLAGGIHSDVGGKRVVNIKAPLVIYYDFRVR